MDCGRFYKQLFCPIEERIGSVDETGIAALIGFDAGGPISLSTIGRGRQKLVTYITCELAVRDEQKPAEFGRYEVMMTCDVQKWGHDILTRIGRMSLASAFGHGHTVDIGQIVAADCPMQGLVVEEFARVSIDGSGYGILRVHGVTRSELGLAMESDVDELIRRLTRAGIYPNTITTRHESIGTTTS